MPTNAEFFAASLPVVDPLWTDLRDMILHQAEANPRNLQRALGPSQVGHPCMRRMAYGMAEVPRSNPAWDCLPSAFGVAMHKWLEKAAHADNEALGRERWIVETKVEVCTGLSGTADLFDTDNGNVIDWKGLHLDTPIPTPDGWSTMGRLTIGDRVLDSRGLACTVTGMSPVFKKRDCYRITFDDGESVVCDDVHQWIVQEGGKSKTVTATAPELRQRLRDRKGQRQLRIMNNSSLDLPNQSAKTPIEPYLLGAWLGDGQSDSGLIFKPDRELFQHIRDLGYEVIEHDGLNSTIKGRVTGLTEMLRIHGFINHKHIPGIYLRASHQERLALMQGLMDTDGTWNKIRNQAVFTTIDKALANDFAELVSTLGWKPRTWKLIKHGFGKTVTAYDVTFVPFSDNPFRLSRKANLVRIEGTTRSKRRVISSIEPTLSVPTKCITVDSPDSTFLCTRSMLPTHNCLGYTSFDRHVRKPGPTYRNQVQLYGRGFKRLGYDVQHVVIAMLPRTGTLTKMHLDTQPYDDQLVDRILARREATMLLMQDLNVEADPERYQWIPATPVECAFCPQWSPNPTNPLQCSGKS